MSSLIRLTTGHFPIMVERGTFVFEIWMMLAVLVSIGDHKIVSRVEVGALIGDIDHKT